MMGRGVAGRGIVAWRHRECAEGRRNGRLLYDVLNTDGDAMRFTIILTHSPILDVRKRSE